MPAPRSKPNPQPIKALRAHVRDLEAAMAVCLAEPRKKAVHKLRSSTRRIEALLQLLSHIPGLPPHRAEVRELRHQLRRMRRAAGAVRDMDVHEELLHEFLHPHARNQAALALRADAETMFADQQKRREALAAKLQDVLQKHEAGIAAALEALYKALKSDDSLHLPATGVVEAAQSDYSRLAKSLRLDRVLAPIAGEAESRRKRRSLSDDQLHDIRKLAKSVRYMLESAAGARRADTLARQYEALQESGGQWHDWLELASESRELLGKKHALTVEMKLRRNRHRTAFLTALGRHVARHALA